MLLRVFILTLVFSFSKTALVQITTSEAETLRMHIWEGYFPTKHREAFKKIVKAKFKVDLDYKITYVTDAKEFYDGLRAGKYDVISPTHNLLKDKRFDFINKKLVIAVDKKNVPNLSSLMPGLKTATYHSQGGKMYAVPYANGPYGLAYNTAKTKDVPDSWKVFLDPKYKGKYSIVGDYSEVNIYIAALAAGVSPSKLTSHKDVDTPKVMDILKTLRKNNKNYWSGVDKPSDLKGKSIATSWGFSFSALAKQGEVWKFAEPKEGSPWWVDNFCLSKTLADKPKLKLIAEALINYLISPEVQLDNVVNTLTAVPVNMKTKLSSSQKASFHMNDSAKAFSKRRILWPTLDKRTRNIYTDMWKRAEN